MRDFVQLYWLSSRLLETPKPEKEGECTMRTLSFLASFPKLRRHLFLTATAHQTAPWIYRIDSIRPCHHHSCRIRVEDGVCQLYGPSDEALADARTMIEGFISPPDMGGRDRSRDGGHGNRRQQQGDGAPRVSFNVNGTKVCTSSCVLAVPEFLDLIPDTVPVTQSEFNGRCSAVGKE